VPDAFTGPTAALMWPGATRSGLIEPSGNLYNGAWRVEVHPSTDGSDAPSPPTIAYEDGWCPIAHWTRREGEIEWSFEAVALPQPVALWRSIENDVSRRIQLAMEEFDRQKQREAFRAWRERPVDSRILDRPRKQPRLPGESIGSLISVEVRATNHGAVDHRARLSLRLVEPGPSEPFYASDAARGPPKLGWAGAATADSAKAWSDLPGDSLERRTDWRLGPGETRVARMVVSSCPCPASELLSWARVPHRERAEQARVFWRGEIERGTLMDLGEREMDRAIRAARVVLLSCRERRGGHDVPLGNPFQDRDVGMGDGALVARALVLHGYVREARQLVRGFREHQLPQGPFLSGSGQLDGSGPALWAYEQVLLRPWRAIDVADYADDAWRAWRWHERMRVSKGETRAAGGEQGPGGTLPAMPAGSPRFGELSRARLAGNDAWTIDGYRAAARLLFAAGRGEDSRAVERSRRAYLADLARAPSASGPHEIPDALQGYVAADLGTWALLRGRRAAADSALSVLLARRDASGSATGLFDRRGHDGAELTPHATEAAVFLTLIRNCLIEDDTDTLRLTLGARRPWWASGTVRRAPTRWGPVDLDFRLRGGVAEWRWSPVPVWTELTLPPGSVPAGRLDPRLRPGPLPNTVLATPGADWAKVAVREAAAPVAVADGSRGR